MGTEIFGRADLIKSFNTSRFTLKHFARGFYPVSETNMQFLPVNRMFFPLKNQNGQDNFVEDSLRKYQLTPGKMYFIPAYLPARIRLDDQLYFLSIQTSLEIFPGVELFSGCRNMLELPIPPEFEELMKIFESNDSSKTSLYAVKAGALAFSAISAILDHYTQEDFWKPLALRKYADLTDYLYKYGNALTSVADLAEENGLSREHFTRHFIADTGITPKQLIDRFVIGHCQALIGEGCTFKEIALRLKFRDEFAFSRYFKRNTGESPRDWRKQHFKDPFPGFHL